MSDTTEVAVAPAPAAVRRPRSRVPMAALLAALAFVALLVAVLNRGDGNDPSKPASAQTETTLPAPTTVARSQAPQTTLATIAPSRPAPAAPAAGSDKDDKDDDKGKGNGKGKNG